jgi:hypothetical protein
MEERGEKGREGKGRDGPLSSNSGWRKGRWQVNNLELRLGRYLKERVVGMLIIRNFDLSGI